VAIIKIIVTISVFVVLITYLIRKWLERVWSSNKWKTVILGFFVGAVLGVIIYYVEKIWLKMHAVKPSSLMPFYLLPCWYYTKYRDGLMNFFKRLKKPAAMKKEDDNLCVLKRNEPRRIAS